MLGLSAVRFTHTLESRTAMRESGHPELAPGLNRGRAGTAFAALGPASAAATGKEELGTICLVHKTRSCPTGDHAEGLFSTCAVTRQILRLPMFTNVH